MQVSNPNNIKIYNLSAGKSLPEWLSDRKKRQLQKQDLDVRRRIELIQDFEMPAVSNCVQVTRDEQYILTTGVYKPRVRCYDVNQLSMKFERCFDAEVVQFEVLSEDYSKVVFLQCDRYIEVHAQHGKYFRLRIPKFGRDLAYHYPSCDLYFVGASADIFRLNLEQGRFMTPLRTNASSNNVCLFNPVHQLFTVGTNEGRVECWDPRMRSRVGILDCALSGMEVDTEVDGIPTVTALTYKDGLTMAVGTSTGQVLLYDIRSDKPLLVKDHQYGLPIKSIAFHSALDLCVSVDTHIVKIWNQRTGKAFTSIEPETDLNDMCVVPRSGLLFLANEAPKLQTYYIPALGPAPKWCGFLDNLTEELEENPTPTVYDDYKFVTKKDLESLGLVHLIGTNLLRAYMHGFFMDIRLYNKAKAIAEPFAFEEYRKQKIREKIEGERANRVMRKKLPKVNKQLAQKLLDLDSEHSGTKTKKKQNVSNLLKDDRFKAMFENPDFQVDETAEEYRLLNPVVSKLDRDKAKRKQKEEDEEDNNLESYFEEVEERAGERSSSDDDSSSDDEHQWTSEMKTQHALLRKQAYLERKREDREAQLMPKFFELKSGGDFDGLRDARAKRAADPRASLAERLRSDENLQAPSAGHSAGSQEMTYTLTKNRKSEERQREAELHHAERKKLRRSAHGIGTKPKPKFWMGKRVQ
ncbi:PREDICTED: nucleolar protein 10-like [Priapulus caudatus]|uniref:Nucleolar protein 10-like n=1 Tax=Priapulus caudatus TaxID=37621 RepID=A0ABM1FAR1_PRICU|nr:PREDICTED: nucleolar protein 10-like [Priapulus caudatus]